jgi:hypothetical protein
MGCSAEGWVWDQSSAAKTLLSRTGLPAEGPFRSPNLEPKTGLFQGIKERAAGIE